MRAKLRGVSILVVCFTCRMTTTETRSVPSFTLADRLRKARQLTGMEQAEFAAKAGMSRSSVANYEQGLTTPRALYLRAWAEVSNVPIEWFEVALPSTSRSDTAEAARLIAEAQPAFRAIAELERATGMTYQDLVDLAAASTSRDATQENVHPPGLEPGTHCLWVEPSPLALDAYVVAFALVLMAVRA